MYISKDVFLEVINSFFHNNYSTDMQAQKDLEINYISDTLRLKKNKMLEIVLNI